jgi:acetyltransferase-like isoleucine patch superfamily enzyme
VGITDDFLLRIKRGDSAPTRVVRDAYKRLIRWNMPDSKYTRPVYSSLYRAYGAYEGLREFVAGKLLFEPMARARFHSVGTGLHLQALPYIIGHARISIGNDCRFGYFSVSSGRFTDTPELTIGDNVSVGSAVRFVVNQRITIGNNVGIASWCWLADSDGHPTDIEAREAGTTSLSEDDFKPITIEDYVWLGHGARILKGVTVGRGAVVAAGSVVAKDVPPGALAMGNPARIIKSW